MPIFIGDCTHLKKQIMRLRTILLSTVFLLIFLCCSSEKSITYSGYDQGEPRNVMTLEERLLQAPGVFIQGNEIRIRGGDQSFYSGSDPLFEIDGQVLTGGYQEALRIVNPVEIRSVRVLKKPDELAMYGTRGLNGVIQIRLKNSKVARGY